jgi:hypothetical protein
MATIHRYDIWKEYGSIIQENFFSFQRSIVLISAIFSFSSNHAVYVCMLYIYAHISTLIEADVYLPNPSH